MPETSAANCSSEPSMKIVILGAGGRLGAALLRKYRDKFEVTGFDLYATGSL